MSFKNYDAWKLDNNEGPEIHQTKFYLDLMGTEYIWIYDDEYEEFDEYLENMRDSLEDEYKDLNQSNIDFLSYAYNEFLRYRI